MCGHVNFIISAPVLFVVVKVCALENLALNKPTWQQHPWPDLDRDFGSENAVDGLYSDRGIGVHRHHQYSEPKCLLVNYAVAVYDVYNDERYKR